MSCFPAAAGPARQEHGVLYRLEMAPRGPAALLVQSRTSPDWNQLPAGYLELPALGPNPATTTMQRIFEALDTRASFRFRLVANPTRDVKVPVDGGLYQEKRVDLRGPEAQYDWLLRKGELHGFRTLECKSAPVPNATIGQFSRIEGNRRGSKLTIAAVRFDGMLEVTDVERFREAVMSGVGRARAYGCGLLSVAPAYT